MVTKQETIMHKKAETFQVLSHLFYEPTEDATYLIEQLLVVIQESYPHLTDETKQMLKSFNEIEQNDLEKLVVDYAKLFLGPFDLLAPPYSSLYLSKERSIFNPDHDVDRFYKRANLSLSKEFRELPNHICAELEFTCFLLLNMQGDDESYAPIYEEFMKEHLTKWIPEFSKRIISNAKTNFYVHLGRILNEVVYEEYKLIKG